MDKTFFFISLVLFGILAAIYLAYGACYLVKWLIKHLPRSLRGFRDDLYNFTTNRCSCTRQSNKRTNCSYCFSAGEFSVMLAALSLMTPLILIPFYKGDYVSGYIPASFALLAAPLGAIGYYAPLVIGLLWDKLRQRKVFIPTAKSL